ncbi:hypothetical protein [Sulfobacillus thermosulfidooxidans]|uniref:hypothetical protein n=1 Tax=Sulfobacillus thermosulfidooxidans TaxID=28034 RepID=UPI001111E023|nr:hypothetical protein [Sulfobacillus thermosulfidooxidans]
MMSKKFCSTTIDWDVNDSTINIRYDGETIMCLALKECVRRKYAHTDSPFGIAHPMLKPRDDNHMAFYFFDDAPAIWLHHYVVRIDAALANKTLTDHDFRQWITEILEDLRAFNHEHFPRDSPTLDAIRDMATR